MNGDAAFVTVFNSGNWLEAYLAANALAGYEIASLILDDYTCRILPSVGYIIGGAKVVVAKEDQQAALDIIGLVYAGNPPYAGSFLMVGIAGGLFALIIALPCLWWRNRHASDLDGDEHSLPIL